jgi:hypothetical protein
VRGGGDQLSDQQEEPPPNALTLGRGGDDGKILKGAPTQLPNSRKRGRWWEILREGGRGKKKTFETLGTSLIK